MSNDILLYKSDFYIKNNYTPKKIPFLWNGSNYPRLVHVSESELTDSFQFTDSTAIEGLYPINHSAYDDWGNELTRDAFSGNYLNVSGVKTSAIIDSAASQDEPYDGNWDNATVSQSSNNLVVSNFTGFSEVSRSTQKVYQPENYRWRTIHISKNPSGTLNVNYPTATSLAYVGIVYLEPCERRWTGPIKLEISYDYPYLKEGVYDIKVSLTSSTNDSEINRLPGIYRILNENAENTSRVWYNSSVNRAIAYNSSAKRWQIVDCSNINTTNKTISLSNTVRGYQYINPADLNWLFDTTCNINGNNIEIGIPAAGTIVNRHNLVEATPIGDWEIGTIEAGVNADELKVIGTVYRELSRNISSHTGSWTNGINVVAGADDSLIVTGFSDNDVNGTYDLFKDSETLTEKMWIHHGTKSSYAISYNTHWKLCTTVDGIYSLIESTESGSESSSSSESESNPLKNIWKCSNGITDNYIFFCRYENKWQIKSCKNLSLTFANSSDNRFIGDDKTWAAVASDGNSYYMRYVAADFCWKIFDSYGNIIDSQVILPTYWIEPDPEDPSNPSTAVVSWSDLQITTDDELSSGTYVEENFATFLSPKSYALENSEIKSCFLVYDFSTFGWRINEKLNINGDYQNTALADQAIHLKTWKLNGSDSSYVISWDSENNFWKLSAYNGVQYDYTQTEPEYATSPDLNIWSNTTTILPLVNSGLSVTTSGANSSDINGTFSLDDNTKTGIFRTWSRIGEYGKYSIEYNQNTGSWILKYYDTYANGTYAIVDSGATGSAKKWSKSENGNSYSIEWNNSILQWNLVKNDTEIMSYSNSIGDPSENVWASGCNTSFDENNPNLILLSNNATTPEANGRYIDDDTSKSGISKTWSKDDGVSIFTIFYDTLSMKWSLRYQNLDFNGEYHPKDESSGTSRIFTHTGEKDMYFLRYDIVNSRWELVSNDETRITYQDEPNIEPTEGHWDMGSVSDPFAGTYLCCAEIPYTQPKKQQYNYAISGNTNGSYTKYNATYVLQDTDSTGSERLWRSPNGTYIKYVGNRWVVTDQSSMTSLPSSLNYTYNNILAYSSTDTANVQNLTTISWDTNYYYFSGSYSMSASHVPEYGSKTLWMAVGDYDEIPNPSGSGTVKSYKTSNIVKFVMNIQSDEITNVSMNVIGSSGSKYFTGFFKDSNGNFIPTDLVSIAYSAVCPVEIRIRFSGGISIPGVDFRHSHNEPNIVSKTGILEKTFLGGTDSYFTIKMEIQDIAGNLHEVSQSITHIARLFRLIGTNIKRDGSGYQTKLYSILSTSSSLEIPKSKTASDEYSRQWNDIFYPATHGYPVNENGEIDYNKALRISKKTIDESGQSGPTTEELKMYDQLQLSNDSSAISVDSDGRYLTSGWQTNKKYNRMESSSYGTDGENLRYWIIDNTGYSDLKLEFEYFDLDSQVSLTPPNLLKPYDGDVLVVYDAQAAGCLEEIVDVYGKKTYKIKDSSLLKELFAFSGSYLNENIKMISGAALPITQTGNGFTTSAITTTSKICIILYTDNDYQASGFKIKAGPRHSVIYYNYDMNNETGEVWIHQEPGTTMNRWYSPSRASSSHQYMTANVSFDYEKGVLTLDSRSGETITGNLATYNYLYTNGTCEAPTTYFTYSDEYSGTEHHPALNKFLLYNDDCVDYYEIDLSVVPEGISPDYLNIYSFENSANNFGKITSGAETNKDKGTITFASGVPLGRIFASYTYHSYYRLTNDGYGDLYFYDNALVPSSDYSTTGLKDWTYVDLMIYNEGSNSLSDGVMKFMSRGYVESSGSSQTITQVVDENRPWDVQSGTISETVNRTGASFSVSYNGLAGKTRGAAVNAINNTSSGGVSFGSSMLPRSKAYIRLYWSLATNDNSSPNYVTTTRGKKLWSSELSGRYFVVTV